jgi:protein-S-isoprenylcysteine O-methyltransferase Ste14
MAEAGPGGDRATQPNDAWWRGRRGEWYVVLQFVLFALVAAGPPTWDGLPAWPIPDGPMAAGAGALLIAGGAALAIAGARQHGAGLQALPYPRDGGTLLISGPYRIVRHPIYSGAVCIALGWAVWRRGWFTLSYVALLFALFDAKARREERWLVERFPSYAGYQRRVRRLVPFLY